MVKKFDTPYKTINCPQCGASLPLYFAHAKLVQCEFCGSSIFLDDEEARLAGNSSVLAPEPSLIKLGMTFSYASKSYLPMGMIRYSYGRGFWEEWWVKDSSEDEYWLSVDEGDMVLEKRVANEYDTGVFDDIVLGQALGKEWVVTEIGIGTCEGFSGSLPKVITVGHKHKYFHLSGYNATLKTVEISSEGMETFVGKWISPFEIVS